MRGLAPALARRFGPLCQKSACIDRHPTRDVPGYTIDRTPIRAGRELQCQLFLPRDASHPDVGTIFHEKLPDGSLPNVSK